MIDAHPGLREFEIAAPPCIRVLAPFEASPEMRAATVADQPTGVDRGQERR